MCQQVNMHVSHKVETSETYFFRKDNLTVQEKLYVEAITVKTYTT